MLITHQVFWGPSALSHRPCVLLRLARSTPGEATRAVAAFGELRATLRTLPGYPAHADVDQPVDLPSLFAALPPLLLFILNYVRGDLTEAGVQADAPVPTLFVEFHHPDLVRNALRVLLAFLVDTSSDRSATLMQSLEALWQRCRRLHPDFQAHALILGARSRGVHYANVGRKIWCYGIGRRSRRFCETSPLSDLGEKLRTDKLSGKALFDAAGAPTAPFRIIRSLEELAPAVAAIGFPCVIKPVHANAGYGVTANIRHSGELAFAFEEALRNCEGEPLIMVEEHIPGRDHRLLFIRGRFVGCASSVAPSVTGDGESTVRALIDRVNAGRTINLYASGFLRPIRLDASVNETLAVQGLSMESVLEPGRTVVLRRNTNLGGGGVSELFDQVHPEVLRIGQRIAERSGLHSVGIDYITLDIRESPEATGGKFTEINRYPGVPLFLAAGFDAATLGSHFLGEEVGNVPVTLRILNQSDFEAARQAPTKPWVIFLPHENVDEPRPRWPGPYAHLAEKVLADRRLERIEVVTQALLIVKCGLPLEHLTRVSVGRECRTPEIEAILRRLRCEVVFD